MVSRRGTPMERRTLLKSLASVAIGAGLLSRGEVDLWAGGQKYQMTPMVSVGFRCVAYDRRGHGRSGQPSHGYDYDTLADDFGTLMEQLDLRGATVIGHSMAPGEIVRYLSRHGSTRISRIVLLAPTTPFILKTADNPDGVPREVFDQTRA